MTDTLHVTATQFQREVSRYQDEALRRPVVVTRNGRERTVTISAQEYHRLKRRDREVLALEDFSNADLDGIMTAPMHPDAAGFDHEVEG
ncbi:hypothetical protein KOAAANKH_02289 [Brevundimonas sp. NIBR10]|uniref:type II toxin-antitoxin system Phd/YefM family antitoxin n=1 Tax=Brevundimonas sp. NIBR10 TaxID=3015997 RepID=UPI0022F1D732|nr:type II toxin-antitoxin system Phd/YefM family antitoxin [Brevundimonas sp. NIBR10]WGM47412.1 hypothetical protein KOAAANKH_02289 [Brevundimonas sp. NIBR10]